MGDKILRCKICGNQFYFTVRDQNRAKANGWCIPNKCPSCRKRIKRARYEASIPRACSTCFFYSSYVDYSEYYHPRMVCNCSYYNKSLYDDSPCSAWQMSR